MNWLSGATKLRPGQDFFTFSPYFLSPMDFNFWLLERVRVTNILCFYAKQIWHFGDDISVSQNMSCYVFSLFHCTYDQPSSGCLKSNIIAIICQICALNSCRRFVVFLAITCQVFLKLFMYEIIFIQGITGKRNIAWNEEIAFSYFFGCHRVRINLKTTFSFFEFLFM